MAEEIREVVEDGETIEGEEEEETEGEEEGIKREVEGIKGEVEGTREVEGIRKEVVEGIKKEVEGIREVVVEIRRKTNKVINNPKSNNKTRVGVMMGSIELWFEVSMSKLTGTVSFLSFNQRLRIFRMKTWKYFLTSYFLRSYLMMK